MTLPFHVMMSWLLLGAVVGGIYAPSKSFSLHALVQNGFGTWFVDAVIRGIAIYINLSW